MLRATLDFQRVLLARRQLADERLGYQQALADFHRNLAQLKLARQSFQTECL
jgi:hypothetical protein